MAPALFVFSGLPGVGKTTLAKKIARQAEAVYLRLDTIEHAIQELYGLKVEGEGYSMARRIARDNLELGKNVVIDCCNPISSTREGWQQLALESKAICRNIEIKCSDLHEHRKRADERKTDIDGFALPTWSEIHMRTYEKWGTNVISIDTAGKSVDSCIRELVQRLMDA